MTSLRLVVFDMDGTLSYCNWLHFKQLRKEYLLYSEKGVILLHAMTFCRLDVIRC